MGGKAAPSAPANASINSGALAGRFISTCTDELRRPAPVRSCAAARSRTKARASMLYTCAVEFRPLPARIRASRLRARTTRLWRKGAGALGGCVVREELRRGGGGGSLAGGRDLMLRSKFSLQ